MLKVAKCLEGLNCSTICKSGRRIKKRLARQETPCTYNVQIVADVVGWKTRGLLLFPSSSAADPFSQRFCCVIRPRLTSKSNKHMQRRVHSTRLLVET